MFGIASASLFSTVVCAQTAREVQLAPANFAEKSMTGGWTATPGPGIGSSSLYESGFADQASLLSSRKNPGDAPPAAKNGVSAAYRVGPFVLTGMAWHGLTQVRNGVIGLLHLDYRGTIIPGHLYFTAGPDFEFSDGQYDRIFSGMTPTQSALGGNFTQLGVHAALTYSYSEHILLSAFPRFTRLTGSIGNNPTKTQTLFGFSVGYQF